jgi:beta-hydroxylase
VFYNPADFPFIRTLEARWETVLDELNHLPDDAFQPWPEQHLYGKGWDGLIFYLLGQRFPANCDCCPETARLVESVPGMQSAGFSVLRPGTRILPHVGYSNELMVCHLALVIPNGCGIRVGTEVRRWTPGKCIIFNDMVEHESWNRSTSTRVVLLMEVTRDGSNRVSDLAVSGELQQFLAGQV